MKLRKKDDKRVLKSPKGNNARNNKRIRRRNNPPHQNNKRFGRNNPRNNDKIHRRNSYGSPKKQNKTSKTTMLIMIVALLAFVIGAGAGVSMALGGGNNDTPQYENVTVEMTTHLNNTDEVYFDEEADHIDFNNKEDVNQYNLTNLTVSY
jgi:hypothetical protein